MRKLFSLTLVLAMTFCIFIPFTAAAATPATGQIVIHNADQVVQTGNSSVQVKATSRQITLESKDGTFDQRNGHVYLDTPGGSTEIKMDNVAACRTRGHYMDITMTADYINITCYGPRMISVTEIYFFDDGSWLVVWRDYPTIP